MNDPSKVIDVNLSSLLSLKAELLRKQSEVSDTKADKSKYYTPNSSSLKRQHSSHLNKRDDKTDRKNNKTKDCEDSSLLEKSRKVLLAKTKYYEQMLNSADDNKIKSDDCLVDFRNKNRRINPIQKADSTDSDSSYDKNDCDDVEWVEYTDCLGRTRKCLKEDLDIAKKRDAELAASMPERIDQTKANWLPENPDVGHHNDIKYVNRSSPTQSLFTDINSVVSKIDEQKASWERTEIENLDKKNVHYQDVFFDEARQHGVGYYVFSTDEEERKKQQRELQEARERTVEEQLRRDTLRAQREKIIAERVLAAKNRQRARLGLPPLEEIEEETSKEKTESLEQNKSRKKLEKEQKKKDIVEKEREEERKRYIRPWDQDKTSFSTTAPCETEEWSFKPERKTMTQEEWNEHNREKRNSDFAPPNNYESKNNLKRTNFTANPFAINNSSEQPNEAIFPRLQTTKKEFKRKNFVETPTVSEIVSRNKTCIPPPENLDIFNGTTKTKTRSELARSIEAGLKFIRDSCDKETLLTKSSWTAKADY